MAWAIWLAVMLVLAMVEVATVNLVFLMMAAGAAAGAIAAYAGSSIGVQLIVAIVVAIAMLFGVRPFFLRQLESRDETRTNVDALIGAKALTLEHVSRRGGTIRLAGEVWSAKCEDDVVIAKGIDVAVIRIEGATAVVREKA